MKRIFLMFLALMAVTVSADNREKMKEFFAPVPDKAKQYPADELYPRGRIFPFSFFSIGGGTTEKRGDLLPAADVLKAQDAAQAAGVTMIGPQYELQDRILKDAARMKVKAAFTINPTYKGEPLTKTILAKLTPDEMNEIGKQISEIVKQTAGDKNIGWWYLQPEELRHWNKNEIGYIKMAYKAIKDADPQKRPVWMYEPGHRDGKALAKLAPYMDISGKGLYTNYSGFKDNRVWCRWTIDQEKKAAAMANPAMVPIAVTEMFQQPKPEDMKKIEDWVRHDVYASLIAGAKGIIVFSLSERPNFTAHDKYREAYFKVCQELCGKQQLGQIFLFGEPKKDLYMSVIEGPEELKVKDETYPSVGMFHAAYGNKRYVFLVNSSNEPVTVVVGDLPYGNVKVKNLFNNDPPDTAPEGDFQVELKPLGVKAFAIYRGE